MNKQVSLDGSWYYIVDGDTVPTGWLSLSGDKDRNGMDWLPFMFWDVKNGEESLATDEEIARYEARNAPMSRPRPSRIAKPVEQQSITEINAIIQAFAEAYPHRAFDPAQVVHHVKALIEENKQLQGRLDSAEEVIKELQSQLGL